MPEVASYWADLCRRGWHDLRRGRYDENVNDIREKNGSTYTKPTGTKRKMNFIKRHHTEEM